ncbi:hypothetical protein [Corynebacterium gallinarum]|uniref:Uncharacterized protein n=1 Tax=Corynebacterium gallinarum TaxID=2762214 RepID=A0A8I0HR00_9CORY|nr:hypothetical protein [Corynebacterium gallinarum]MBD8030863.1 hypothetical protein [Corynebacterium gallinarum]
MLLPESILTSDWFAALAAFVAINTAIYVTLAVVKTLPRIYYRDYLPRTYERSETRSIYPDTEERKRKG